MTGLEQRSIDAYQVLAAHCRVDGKGFTWFDDRAGWVEGVEPAEQLAAHLYTHFYTSGGVVRRATHAEVTRDLQPHYDRIAGSERVWFDGWKVTARHPTGVRITDGTVHLSIADEDVRAVEGDDDRCLVRLPLLRRRMSPGFCVIPATRAMPAGPLVRVYVSVSAAGAPALLATFLRHRHQLTDVQAKQLNSTSNFHRLDSFVAYLHPARLSAITSFLAEVVRDPAIHLRTISPSLTGVLAPGIALAAEPAGGGSFGTTVCLVLAEALVAGDPSRIPAALQAAGLSDVAVPSALVASARRTGLHTPPPRPSYVGDCSGAPESMPLARSAGGGIPSAADLARDIADVLASSALTVGDQVTWVWHPPTLPVGPATALATVGPDRYGGTAGIGTFLLAAAGATGCERYQKVGRRALRHTAARLAAGWRRHGAYTGSAGAALALLQAGAEVVGDDAVDHAVTALLQAGMSMPGEENPDLLSGVAGTLLAVLRAYWLLPDPALFACATSLRDRLMKMADGDTGGWPGEDGIALTGFSHGAAGIAYVLSHWLKAAADPLAEQLLTRTIAFEDCHFDPAVNNWADLRSFASGSDDGPHFAQFWCHGSPGIVLARRAIGADLPQPVDVATAVDAVLSEPGANEPGLCHGLTGLVDIADTLKGCSDQRRAALLRRLHERGPVPTWSESRPDTLRPGLMLGLAGVGDYLLRTLSDDRTSPLLP